MEWNIHGPDPYGFEQVSLQGDCDLYHAPAFASAMLTRIEAGTRKLRFDFSEVSYLDSSGVGAVIKIVQAARRHSVNLRFSGIKGSPRKVLRMSNILPLLREEEGSAAE